jgi:hypothetical protein
MTRSTGVYCRRDAPATSALLTALNETANSIVGNR